MKILGNEIKPGMILNYDNDQWEVIKTQHVKPGKGGAFNQVELKSINKDTKRNERFRSNDNVQRVVLEEKKFNFLFEDDNDCHFMNQITFEQMAINKKKNWRKNKTPIYIIFLCPNFLIKCPVINDGRNIATR